MSSRRIGADIPFFLVDGPAARRRRRNEPRRRSSSSQAFTVLVLVPKDETKVSTAEVYAAFDTRGGSAGYDGRRSRLLEALAAGDLAGLPPNDLATPSHAKELRRLGAFRQTSAGPAPP